MISEVTFIIQPTGDWCELQPQIPATVHRLKRYFPDTAKKITRIEGITEKVLLEELVDSTDEYLESTGTVDIPTKWKEYSHPNTVRVEVPEEQEDIVDVGHIGLDRGEVQVNNLHKTHGACRQDESGNGATSQLEVPNNNLHKTRGACRQEESDTGVTMQKSSQAEQSNLHKATGTCRQREEGQKPNKEASDKTVTLSV